MTHDALVEGRLTVIYRRIVTKLIANARLRNAFLGSVVILLAGAMACVGFGWVQVKMLPFDNKSEFQVVIDMPEGTPLEQTDRVAQALADVIRREPEVENYQTYVGTSGPYNFNGLVRHYFLRQGGNVADVRVNLVGKEERRAQSHEIAKRVRRAIEPLAARFGARVKVAEVPPGPPVLEALVAEIYGPDPSRRQEIAQRVRELMEKTPGVVDVDWQVENARPKYRLVVDQEKAALNGVSEAQIVQALRVAASGETAGVLHDEREKQEVPILVGLDRATRSDLARQLGLRVRGSGGNLVSVGELVKPKLVAEGPSIYHKNLMPVVYVMANFAGAAESPVYAIMNLGKQIESMRLPEGYALDQSKLVSAVTRVSTSASAHRPPARVE